MSRHRLVLILILAAYLLLALGFGVKNPLFEAPDEDMHYFTVEYIAETGSLPQVGEVPDPFMAQEAAQPPLYYLLSSLIIRPFGETQAKELVWSNPRVQLGDASALDNTNTFIHPASESWPWEDFVLNAHILRIISTLFGLGTLLFIYGSAALIWPQNQDLPLLAVALVAFLPQFSFLHGSISNDPLVILLSSAAVWQLIRMWFKGLSWTALLLLGVTIGLTILTKMAGLLLLLYALIFLTVIFFRQRGEQPLGSFIPRWLLSLALVAAVALLMSGWILWRNFDLYGDLTATAPFITIAGGDRDYSLLQVIREMPSLLNSSFAIFGWMNVRPANWVLIFWKSLLIVSLIGAIVHLVKDVLKDKSIISRTTLFSFSSPLILPGLLFLWTFMVYAGLIRFLLQTPAAQGRLLFPALIPLVLLMTYGLSVLRSRWLYAGIGLIAFVTAAYSLFVVIPNAYAAPAHLPEADIPQEADLLNIDMGDGLSLLGSWVESGSTSPGEIVWLTLYWQNNQAAPAPSSRSSPEFVLELFGREDELVGKVQSYHGGGLYPLALWPTGVIVADRIGLRLAEEMVAPTKVRLNLKLAGAGSSFEIGSLKSAPLTWPEDSGEFTAELKGLRLIDADFGPANGAAGQDVSIDLTWKVINSPGRDLTTFIHLGDPTEEPLAQGDSPPLSGDYPTSLWSDGEIITDSYSISIPDGLPVGRYPIYIGMYDPQTGIRLPLTIDSQRQPQDAFLIGQFTITSDP